MALKSFDARLARTEAEQCARPMFDAVSNGSENRHVTFEYVIARFRTFLMGVFRRYGLVVERCFLNDNIFPCDLKNFVLLWPHKRPRRFSRFVRSGAKSV